MSTLGKRTPNGPAGSPRPKKKQKSGSELGPELEYHVLAQSTPLQKFFIERSLPYGVVFELARLITLGKLNTHDITLEKLDLLIGSNTTSAPRTTKVFFPCLETSPDPAFAQEHAVKSPWEELDREEGALLADPYSGLGHSDSSPGWYGGKIVFGGKLHHHNSNYRIELERAVLGPSCRFKRRFGSPNFLHIKIPSNLLHNSNSKLREFFFRPFILWGRVFRSFYAKDRTVFLFRTNEMMMDGKFYPDHFPGPSLLRFLDWHNPLETNANQVMPKWAARMALGLSNSVPGPLILSENVMEEDDIISSNGSEMTDGCGSGNKATHVQIFHIIKPETYPTGVQFRFEGYKGMITERSDSSIQEPMKMFLRPSQKKISYPLHHHCPLDPTLKIVEILRTSYMKSPARISPETIINLPEHGVPSSVFIKLLKQSLVTLVEELTTWDGPDANFTLWRNVERLGAVLFSRRAREAAGEARVRGLGEVSVDDDDEGNEDEDGIQFDKAFEERSSAWWADQISGCPSSLEETVMVLLDAGFTPQNSPILREKLKQVVTTRIKAQTSSIRFHIPCSASAFVVPDPYGVLGIDEIQIRSSRRNLPDIDGLLTDVIVGDVLLTRNPCKVPTDIRKVFAVEHPQLRNYTDVIVCSVNGLRRLLDFLAGGDYDGDRCMAIWEPSFVVPFKNADEKYSVEPLGIDKCFSSSDGNEKVATFLARTVTQGPLEKTLELQKYLLGALQDPSIVGKYSKMHDNAVYRYGYGHPKAIRLAYIFCKVLDGAKTGLKIKPNTLREDWKTYCGATRGPQWKENSKEKKESFDQTNLPCLTRKKNDFIKQKSFIMDDLQRAAMIERDRILADMDALFAPLKSQPDPHLTQPWHDAIAHAERGSPDVVQAKQMDLSLIIDHVQRIFAEHQSTVQTKNFTSLPIERRQDTLRALSKKFSDSPMIDEMNTIMDQATISRLRASYAYVYDAQQRAGRGGWSRFPWNVAMRELCHIKASALGPFKTVTGGFYERFKLSRR